MLDGPNRRVVQASASDTGLPDQSADVVLGEAYLTMQPDSLKRRIVSELERVLRPGGRFALHEVAFAPDDIHDAVRTRVEADPTSPRSGEQRVGKAGVRTLRYRWTQTD